MPTRPCWRTSALGHAADTSPAELSDLGAHLRRCRGPNGLRCSLQCGTEAAHHFVAGRTVTTLAAVALLVALAALAL